MAHGNTVIDSNGIKFFGNAPRFFDFPGHQFQCEPGATLLVAAACRQREEYQQYRYAHAVIEPTLCVKAFTDACRNGFV